VSAYNFRSLLFTASWRYFFTLFENFCFLDGRLFAFFPFSFAFDIGLGIAGRGSFGLGLGGMDWMDPVVVSSALF
jgi:hypothetical protein